MCQDFGLFLHNSPSVFDRKTELGNYILHLRQTDLSKPGDKWNLWSDSINVIRGNLITEQESKNQEPPTSLMKLVSHLSWIRSTFMRIVRGFNLVLSDLDLKQGWVEQAAREAELGENCGNNLLPRPNSNLIW